MSVAAVLGLGIASDPAAAVSRWAGGRAPPRLGRLDEYTRLAVLAADAAVRDAGLDWQTVPGDRVGVVLGTALGCYESNHAYRESLAGNEPSPRLFAATLPSTPVGEIALHVGARGPQLALAQGAGSGLAALAEARRLLLAGRADLAIAGFCDALPSQIRALYPGAPEDGACFFVLAREQPHRGLIHGGGLGFGADARARAVAAACREAEVDVPPTETTRQDWVSAVLGRGRLTTVVALDPLGAASALVVS